MRERIKHFFLSTRSFWQAVFVALVITLVTLGLYLLFLANWDYKAADELDRMLIQLAIGQVFTGFAAIFFTITLGVFAVREFMERRTLPDVELLFSDPDDDEDKGYQHIKLSKVSRRSKTFYQVNVQVRNAGSVTAVWYRFELRVPFLVPGADAVNQVLDPWSQTEKHWTSLHYYQDDEVSLIFSSQGTIVAYPKWPILLGGLRIPVERAAPLPRDYICPFKLIVDGQPMRYGELRITLRKPSS